MKLLQINTVINSGSTGRIAEEIGQQAIAEGWESYIAYGRNPRVSQSHAIRIGNDWDVKRHGLETRFFDNHGLASRSATRALLQQIEQIQPDIIHLHNIHGYYLNYPLLFQYIEKKQIPVVWTLHDCWPFTGHCSHFTYAKCERWKDGCYNCPQKNSYPGSLLLDRSPKNFRDKKRWFSAIQNMTLVPVSNWLADIAKASFLGNKYIHRIYNGIDTEVFTPKDNQEEIKKRYGIPTPFFILGVASVWPRSKGLQDFIELSKHLPEDVSIVLVGLTKNQIKILPSNCLGISRTENMTQLAELYSAADLFINASIEETFGLTTAESLACGTPAAVYDSTACPEVVNELCGFVVNPNDINGLLQVIDIVKEKGKLFYTQACRERALTHFKKQDRYAEYMDLFKLILTK